MSTDKHSPITGTGHAVFWDEAKFINEDMIRATFGDRRASGVLIRTPPRASSPIQKWFDKATIAGGDAP